MRRALLLALLAACGGSSSADDAGADGSASCRVDADCDDGRFCTGVGRCDPSAAGADARGCVAASPCMEAQTCDEEARRCETDCEVTRDADGDGARARECGGDDCDDADERRHPGATEVCDAAGLDEDCDERTVGDRDADGDGFVDATCCNGSTCGDDCDDGDAAVRPGGVEVCDEVDQDCDASVDEGVQTVFYRDADRDGFGAGDTLSACTRPDGYAPTDDDCDDANPAVHPAAFDRCDGVVDDDCSGEADDPPGGCECVDGASRTCPFPGVCAGSTQACSDGIWGACGIGAGDEVCGNELDDDCDGAVDERCACEVASRVCGVDRGVCSRGIQDCAADGSWGPCLGDVRPSPEVCNTLDDDCDGRSDEGLTLRCWVDEDRDGYAWPSAAESAACGSCPAGTTARDPSVTPDCDGNDARAFPGQTAYFGTPRTSVGGFDFDCDGELENDAPGPCRLNAAGDDCAFEISWTASRGCGEFTPTETCAYMGPDTGCVGITRCTPFVGSTCDRLRCR